MVGNFHYPINIKGFLESVFLRTNIIGKGFSRLLRPLVSCRQQEGRGLLIIIYNIPCGSQGVSRKAAVQGAALLCPGQRTQTKRFLLSVSPAACFLPQQDFDGCLCHCSNRSCTEKRAGTGRKSRIPSPFRRQPGNILRPVLQRSSLFRKDIFP